MNTSNEMVLTLFIDSFCIVLHDATFGATLLAQLIGSKMENWQWRKAEAWDLIGR